MPFVAEEFVVSLLRALSIDGIVKFGLCDAGEAMQLGVHARNAEARELAEGIAELGVLSYSSHCRVIREEL